MGRNLRLDRRSFVGIFGQRVGLMSQRPSTTVRKTPTGTGFDIGASCLIARVRDLRAARRVGGTDARCVMDPEAPLSGSPRTASRVAEGGSGCVAGGASRGSAAARSERRFSWGWRGRTRVRSGLSGRVVRGALESLQAPRCYLAAAVPLSSAWDGAGSPSSSSACSRQWAVEQ